MVSQNVRQKAAKKISAHNSAHVLARRFGKRFGTCFGTGFGTHAGTTFRRVVLARRFGTTFGQTFRRTSWHHQYGHQGQTREGIQGGGERGKGENQECQEKQNPPRPLGLWRVERTQVYISLQSPILGRGNPSPTPALDYPSSSKI